MQPMTIRRTLQIPATATVLVSPGDPVMPWTPVARVDMAPGRLLRVNVAGELKIDKKMVPKRLVVRPGEKVSEGDVLAVGGCFFSRKAVRSPGTGTLALVSKHRGFAYVRENVETGSQETPVELPVAETLGVSPVAMRIYLTSIAEEGKPVVKGQLLARRGSTLVQSPIYGRVTEVSFSKGTITVSPLYMLHQVLAGLKGKVENVVPGEYVEVSGTAQLITGIWGLGGDSYGPIHVIDGDLGDDTAVPQGSVVVSRGTATYEGLRRCAESGVKGLVLGWLGSSAAMRFAGGIRNMGITGDEAVPFPLILTQGFLPEEMDQSVFKVRAGSAGRLCSLRGATHIRAGVVRPEILVFPE